ncbi:hypothetical protein MBM_03294 [Drepanopeziza brunnea f. sp. 'multigermtubi' MB_m1]|uniref:Uncharacterized protein n=1 Tax=Marssonina brunnea f. sp. multigermtubi (strain MB_m1) TaxID=1072389 RepID=K1WZ88_MARBU|nr:uncharacterized protein MBM_03294 [Drepanopeziza brunnea f. sp. 'multigermtubi' MB_m1]EKD18301.1 hypothetical protein MBM_03294 [Drepanopeziza brunnea f. sp. 'multigermtubi' MB_m1]
MNQFDSPDREYGLLLRPASYNNGQSSLAGLTSSHPIYHPAYGTDFASSRPASPSSIYSCDETVFADWPYLSSDLPSVSGQSQLEYLIPMKQAGLSVRSGNVRAKAKDTIVSQCPQSADLVGVGRNSMISGENDAARLVKHREMDYALMGIEKRDAIENRDVKGKGKAVELKDHQTINRSPLKLPHDPSRGLDITWKDYWTEDDGGRSNVEREEPIYDLDYNYLDHDLDTDPPHHEGRMSSKRRSRREYPPSPRKAHSSVASPSRGQERTGSPGNYAAMNIDELLRGMEADSDDDDDTEDDIPYDMPKLRDFRGAALPVARRTAKRKAATESPAGLGLGLGLGHGLGHGLVLGLEEGPNAKRRRQTGTGDREKKNPRSRARCGMSNLCTN